MIFSFPSDFILSKVVTISFPRGNICIGVHGGYLDFTPLNGYLNLPELLQGKSVVNDNDNDNDNILFHHIIQIYITDLQ